jgi:hypothetical protein
MAQDTFPCMGCDNGFVPQNDCVWIGESDTDGSWFCSNCASDIFEATEEEIEKRVVYLKDNQ